LEEEEEEDDKNMDAPEDGDNAPEDADNPRRLKRETKGLEINDEMPELPPGRRAVKRNRRQQTQCTGQLTATHMCQTSRALS